jgi:gluconokinase
MAPLPKLVWFREEEPELFARARHWVGIKDYVLWKLLRVLVTDYSMASGTGLMDIHRLQWDPESLDLAGISPDQLPELVGTTTVVPELPPETAKAVQLPSETSVVVGAGDGPLANLGLGAVRPGVAACSIGTSGALRVMVEQPTVDEQGRVFCYALTDQRWVVGGAINNGGLVLEWCGDALAPELSAGREDELLRQAGTVPAGADGLSCCPTARRARSALELATQRRLCRVARRPPPAPFDPRRARRRVPATRPGPGLGSCRWQRG